MNVGQEYATVIFGFVFLGIILFKARMPKAGLCSIGLAILYPIGSMFFTQAKDWIFFADSKFGNFMFTSLFPRIMFAVPIIAIAGIIFLAIRGNRIGGILLGIATALGIMFYGLYRWEQNLIDIFSKSTIVTFFEWETFCIVLGAGILLIVNRSEKKINGEPRY